MKKRNIRFAVLTLLLALILLVIFVDRFHHPARRPVTLHFCIMNELNNQEHVLAEFQKRTKEELGLNIRLESQSPDAYKKNLPNMLRTQSDLDLVFDAPWFTMNQNISDGLYVDLEPYLESGDYPGLSAVFTDRYLDDSRINGKIYGLPITKNFYDAPGIIYRKDLLESYNLGFDTITSLEQLQEFYEAVLTHNPEMTPLSVGSRGFYYLLFEDSLKLQNENVFDVSGISWPTLPVKVLLSQDQKQVLDVLFLGDDLAEGERDYFSEAYLKQADWNRYLSKDSLMSADSAYALLNGTAASYENTLGEGTISLQDSLQEKFPDATLAFYPSDASLQKDTQNVRIAKGLTAWNYICIPKSSRHIEETLQFLDWMFSSQENNDLFTYGVEGVDWIDVGDQEYRLNENNENRYEIPAYTFSYHPAYLRVEQRLNDKEKELIALTADPDTFTGSPLTGFGIDYGSLPAEWEQIRDLYAEYHLQFMHGTYQEKTREKIQEFHQRAEALCLEHLRQAIRTQIQTFLDQRSASSQP